MQIQWRALDEINAGVCDGMTYEEIKKNMPEEYEYALRGLPLHSFPKTSTERLI
jgi:6-phosphofructo-2-kinase/fructose-2,6-biphosphatase